MITVDLRDTKLKENLEAIKELKERGYSDEELQKLYDEQVQTDRDKVGGMVKCNLNDCIHIKLTEHGKEIIIKDYGIGYYEACVESYKTEQGYYRLQLWTVMSYFGKYLYNGCKLPFEPNIYFEGGAENENV